VGQMNFDLDLRSPEYRATNTLIKPRTFRSLLYVAALIMLVIFFFLLNIYRLHLVNRMEILEAELTALENEAKPLLLMISETEAVIERSAIEKKLQAFSIIKTEYLKILKASAPPGTTIDYIFISSDGLIELKGSCPNLQDSARYNRLLSELPFINSSEIISAASAEEEVSTFSIRAMILNESEGITDEQN
jgi:hypothetical protein